MKVFRYKSILVQLERLRIEEERRADVAVHVVSRSTPWITF